MKILYPAGVKREYFDRNAIETNGSFVSSALAPHAITARISYTVPVGKRAVITTLFVIVERATVGTTAFDAEASVYVNNQSLDRAICTVLNSSNVVGVISQAAIGLQYYLKAGDGVTGYTQDSSTGGSCLYRIGFGILEFEA